MMRSTFALAMMLCAALVRAGEPVATALPNPGFEEGASMWSLDGSGQLMAEAAHGGKMGLRVGAMNYDAAGASVLSARLPVPAGTEVTLTFDARTTAVCSGAYLWFYDAVGKLVTLPRDAVCIANTTDNAWHTYALHMTVPAGAAAVAVWVHAFPGSIGTADYDNFVLGGISPDAVALPPPPARKTPALKPVDLATLAPRRKPVNIVIKLDDLKQQRGDVPEPWKRVDAYLATRHVKAGYGIICETLTNAMPAYTNWIRTRQESGRVEFWFHGWTHGPHLVNGRPQNEFAGWNDADMRSLVERSQKAAREKLGFAFRTFGPTGSGAPGPLMDAVALRAMHDDPDIQVVLYPAPLDEMGKAVAADGKLTILDRVWAVNLESSVGVPDCQRLIRGYADNPQRTYFVLQGHPAQWSGERFTEFTRIIDFLSQQGARFMTPSECAAALQAPPGPASNSVVSPTPAR